MTSASGVGVGWLAGCVAGIDPRTRAARELEQLQQMGVDRVVVMPWEHSRDALAAIEDLRGKAQRTVQFG